MSTPTPSTAGDTPTHGTVFNAKAITALAIVAVAVIFILSNLGEQKVNFLFITISIPGWLLYLGLFAGGAAVGFFLGRNRYKRK